MISSESIDKLCTKIGQQQPFWPNIKERFEALPAFKKKLPLMISQYAQDFSELYLDLALENICKFAEFNSTILPHYHSTNPLKQGEYKLYHNYMRRVIINCNNNIFWEYDQIIHVDNIPVVLEMKIRQWNTGKKRKRKQQNGSYTFEKNNCVKNNLRPELYNRKLDPVRKMFGQEVGYIMIIPCDQYESTQHSPLDSIVGQFIHNNGKIVPFYTDRLTFREHVREKVKEFGYPLKEEPQQSIIYFL
jgi:hypothetical protein